MSAITKPSKALPPWWSEKVKAWLHNDVPGLDIGGMVVGGTMCRAWLRHSVAMPDAWCAHRQTRDCTAAGKIAWGHRRHPLCEWYGHLPQWVALHTTLLKTRVRCAAVFEYMGCSIEWYIEEGSVVHPVKHIATVAGPARNILIAERTALNIITRASGIATQARAVRGLADAASWHGEIVGTRKTTPGAWPVVHTC